MAERIEQAYEAMRYCQLCPRACAVDRTAGQTGYCGLTHEAHVFREVLHYGEEAELIPSHQVFFTGCNLRCEFCAVAEWNAAPESAPLLDVAQLRECILARQKEGARTLNFLGGEPSVSLYGALKLLAVLPDGISLVWNSSMYFAQEAASLLDGVVDIYLADFKVGNADCAETLLDARDYVEVVRENLAFAQSTADLIVRHLVMPGHEACCLEPVLRWIKENMPEVKLSLRKDYLPPARALHAPAGMLSQSAFQSAMDRAHTLGLNLIA